MKEGYWVVFVRRESGESRVELHGDRDQAWQRALDCETPEWFTTVVDQRVRDLPKTILPREPRNTKTVKTDHRL